jgi:group I intron endonuclease
MRPVIYGIRNSINNKIYIGSAEDWDSRKGWHQAALKRNGHFNPHLQHAWNKYGEEVFEFFVIEDVPQFLNETDQDFKIRLVDGREQYYIDFFSKNIYNIRKKASSALGLKRSAETIKRLSDAKLGEKNPMFGKDFSQEHRNKLSESHLGEKSYWFGKTRTEETKQLIRERSKVECTDEIRLKLSSVTKKSWETRTSHCRRVSINETIYRSIRAASKELGISKHMVSYRCNLDHYPDYKFVD